MKYIGAHVSTEGGVANAPLEAIAIGAKSFALFTGSINRWTSKAIPEGEVHAFKENCRRGDFTADQILPHDNVLINLGSPDPQKLHLSRKSFLEEMKRCEQLGLTMLNFHPGSHLNEIEEEKSLDLIAESINITLDQTDGVTAVLESTAGQGSNLGYRFEHLAHIIAKVEDKSRVGVCIDTCHTYSAGYDLADEEGYRKTWHDPKTKTNPTPPRPKYRAGGVSPSNGVTPLRGVRRAPDGSRPDPGVGHILRSIIFNFF